MIYYDLSAGTIYLELITWGNFMRVIVLECIWGLGRTGEENRQKTNYRVGKHVANVITNWAARDQRVSRKLQ